ncbi:MAG: hypothetical protein M3416_06220 [Acidobacteriota bacterium]|nr:hypothetical protein [Acidobacteriota bacterium]
MSSLTPEHLEALKNVVDIVVALGLLTLAVISALWARREWRYQHITKEWGGLVQFLLSHARYMDAERNANYRTEYQGVDAVKYQLVARLCLAYLDDVYHLKMWHYKANWLVGSVAFLAGTHRAWLKANAAAYSEDFHNELLKCLKEPPPT